MVKEGSEYPALPYLRNIVPKYEFGVIEDYLNTRIKKHFESEALEDRDLDYCSDSELWRDLPQFRVIKKHQDGTLQTKAKFTAGSRIEAEEWASNNRDKIRTKEEVKKGIIPQVYIHQKKSVARYCKLCPCLNFCEQGQMEVGQDQPETEETDE